MKKYPFYSALSHCYEMYGVELDEDQFETYAMSAWFKIGNKDYKIYKTRMHPIEDPDGGWYVCMPCNLSSIEAITLDFEDAQETSAVENYHINQTLHFEQDVEFRKWMPNELYARGKYVKYKELGDRIYFTEPYDHVNILYKGLYADEDGLPFLNQKEMEAIAAYCAYVHDYKQARLSKDSATMQLSQIQEAKWKKLCSAARVPLDISQNLANEILDASTSWDRKMYGRSYKPIR